MGGDARVRHCAQCNLNVYNLSSMSRAQAEALIERTEGRLCVRLYRRVDGTVITDDCPVGLAARARRRMGLIVAGTLALLSAFAFALCLTTERSELARLGPVRTVIDWFWPEEHVTMGVPCDPLPRR